ncbi:MAG: hypothetical protein JNM70_06570 [Anaerolineae bacterium]|nr:hypothetical protein [Anaerolineae bacterium]
MRKGIARYGQCTVWVLMTCAGIACFQILLAFALNPIGMLTSIDGHKTPVPIEETFSLPVNTASDVLTAQMYDSYVTITVWGEGQIDADTWHDAFTEYRRDGSDDDFQGFLVDGQRLAVTIFSFSPTRGNPEISEYLFTYYVGDPPRQIAFRMVNGNPDDQSVFLVRVDSRNWLPPPRR